jgi:hypothetical protein
VKNQSYIQSVDFRNEERFFPPVELLRDSPSAVGFVDISIVNVTSVGAIDSKSGLYH